MDEISFRGASIIGWVNTSYPLVKLTCNRRRLALGSLPTHEFTPEQVVSIRQHGSIPLIGKGLPIEHNRLDYPAQVVFLRIGSRQRVLDEIARVGFIPSGVAVERARGMPFRWTFAIACVLLWNIGFLVDVHGPFRRGDAVVPFGPGVVATLAALFVLATGIKASARLQRVALAPGHVVREVRGLLSLLQGVAGAMTVGFALALFLAGQA